MRNRAEVADVPVLGFILNELRTGRRRPRPARNALRDHDRNRAKQEAEPRPLALSVGS
jgi:hypothetical protein